MFFISFSGFSIVIYSLWGFSDSLDGLMLCLIIIFCLLLKSNYPVWFILAPYKDCPFSFLYLLYMFIVCGELRNVNNLIFYFTCSTLIFLCHFSIMKQRFAFDSSVFIYASVSKLILQVLIN